MTRSSGPTPRPPRNERAVPNAPVAQKKLIVRGQSMRRCFGCKNLTATRTVTVRGESMFSLCSARAASTGQIELWLFGLFPRLFRADGPRKITSCLFLVFVPVSSRRLSAEMLARWLVRLFRPTDWATRLNRRETEKKNPSVSPFFSFLPLASCLCASAAPPAPAPPVPSQSPLSRLSKRFGTSLHI